MEAYVTRAEAIKEYLETKKHAPAMPIPTTDEGANGGGSRIPRGNNSSQKTT